MKKFLLLLAALVVFAVSSMAFAEDKSNGCGLGWMVSKRTSLLSTSVRGTTHAFLPPTFSMTSGTSGCAQHSLALRDVEAIQFVNTNIVPLKIEMAQGNGENLRAFARTMGCGDAAFSDFSAMTQEKYDSINTGKNGFDIFQNTKAAILAHPVLSKTCSA